MTDLASIKPGERTLEINHPATGAPLGVRVRLVSIDDDRLTKLKRQMTDERMRLEARGKAFKADDVENNARMLLFTATLGWEWYNPTGKEGDDGFDATATPEFEGEVPEFNQRNFMAIAKALPWFAAQMSEVISETKDFFDNSLRS